MSDENLERWRAGIELFRSGTSESDRESMLARVSLNWDPEIEWDASDLPLPDLAGIVHGRESMSRWWKQFLDAWETTGFDYELIDAGDQAVMLIDQRMRGRSTGIEVGLGEYALLATFRGGLITHLKLYLDQATALAAAGLK